MREEKGILERCLGDIAATYNFLPGNLLGEKDPVGGKRFTAILGGCQEVSWT